MRKLLLATVAVLGGLTGAAAVADAQLPAKRRLIPPGRRRPLRRARSLSG